MNYVTLTPVDSEAIAAVGYDGYTLYVQFHSSDKVYEHHGVPESVVHAFFNASSMGRFYAQNIRGRYR